jgi:hypothetical protein
MLYALVAGMGATAAFSIAVALPGGTWQDGADGADTLSPWQPAAHPTAVDPEDEDEMGEDGMGGVAVAFAGSAVVGRGATSPEALLRRVLRG